MFDPAKYGAVPVKKGFDPSKYGAKPASAFPKQEPLSVTQDFMSRLQQTGKTGEGPLPQKPMTYSDRLLNLDGPAYDLSNERMGIQAAPKVATNIANSIIRFGNGTLDFLNPLHSGDTVKKIVSGGNLPGLVKDFRDANASTAAATKAEQAKGKKSPLPPSILMPGGLNRELGSAAYQTVTPPALQKVFKGKFTEGLQSVAEDPAQLAPALLGLEGGLKGTKAGAALDKAMSTVAKPVTAPIEALGRGVKSTAEFGVSQATGMSPETIKTIRQNPDAFSIKKIAETDRTGLVDTVHSKISKRLEALSETGKGYDVIRNEKTVANVSPTWISDSLTKNGWSDGQMAIDANGVARPGFKPTKLANISTAEQSALTRFMDVWGSKKSLTAEEFLDGRKYLDSWSKWQSEVASTEQGKALFRELRKDFNTEARGQFKGLEQLDAKYGPEAAELRKIQSEYLNSDGTLKDNASSKIANLTNKGREMALERLRKIDPNIEKQIRIVKAVEDISAAGGQKVGTYARAGTLGAGLVTMNPAMVVSAILANPAIATQLIRFVGKAQKVSSSVLEKSVNAVQTSLNSEPNFGLSTKDVSGNPTAGFGKFKIKYKDPKTGKVTQLKNLDRDTARGWHQWLTEQGISVTSERG